MTVQRTQELPELAAPINGNRIKDESVWQFAFRPQSSPTGWFLLAQISGHLREYDSPQSMFRLGKYENAPKFITLLILIGSIVCMLYMQPKFEDYLWNRNLWEVLSWPISFIWMLLILVGSSGAWGSLAIAALIAIVVLVDNRAADEMHTTREDPDDRDFW